MGKKEWKTPVLEEMFYVNMDTLKEMETAKEKMEATNETRNAVLNFNYAALSCELADNCNDYDNT